MNNAESSALPAADTWNRLETPMHATRLLRFGGSRVWIERRPTGWRIALEPPQLLEPGEMEEEHGSAIYACTPAEKPEEPAWSSYYVDDAEDALIAEFSLPDKPVAAHPLDPIFLPDGESARFTTPIPLDLKLRSVNGGRELVTVPSMILSKSLFGSPDSGEIVYSSPLKVAPGEEEFDIPVYCACCDLKVQNISGGVLDFSRVCLRVEYLGLYLQDGRFATDGINFAFRGGEHASSLSFSRRSESPNCRRVTPPRITGYGSLIRKSFDFFRSLANY